MPPISTGAASSIALLELVVPEVQADLASASFDLQMLMGTRGRERTLPEWQDLFQQSGVLLEEQVGLQSPGNILLLKVRN